MKKILINFISFLLWVGVSHSADSLICNYSFTDYPIATDSKAIIKVGETPVVSIKFLGDFGFVNEILNLDDSLVNQSDVDPQTCKVSSKNIIKELSYKFDCPIEESEYSRTIGWLYFNYKKGRGYFRYKMIEASGKVEPYRYVFSSCEKYIPEEDDFGFDDEL